MVSDLYLAPELSLTLLALVVLIVDLFVKRRIVTVTVALVGLVVPMAFAISQALTLDFSVAHHAFFNMLVVDQYAIFFKIVFLMIAAVILLASYSYVWQICQGGWRVLYAVALLCDGHDVSWRVRAD